MIIYQLERMEHFTSQEQEIAKFVLAYPIAIRDMSTDQLAKATFTSPATVVRLCKKLETEGYHDFKLKFSLEYVERAQVEVKLQDSSLSSKSTYAEHNAIITNLYQSALASTDLMISPQQIQRIANRLQRARKIDIYGYGIGYTLANQAAFKLLSIGVDCMAHDGINEHYIAASKKPSDMVAILISFTGKNASMLRVAKYLKEKGIYVISLTGPEKTELTQQCNENIHVDTDKTIAGMEAITSIVSIQYVLDILFSLLKTYHQEE
ncbi:MurR/RpiR family transcriptional regulator [Paenibacillus sp. WLX1005]|uniref:MurR/RpiR family transcriptional regulator n=1 Tax=Paenibacillus sp. WLX1005 TaxID=3243766 RepID=UPI00398430B0